MNERIEHCLYQAGLTAQGCWDELDDYARQGIEKFAEVIVAECTAALFDESERLSGLSLNEDWDSFEKYEICSNQCIDDIALIEKHFGVEE